MTGNKYEHYSVEDFVWDEAFRNWVLVPNPHSTAFWENWLQQHPEKENIIRQAIEVVRSLTINMEKLSRQKKEEIIANTMERLNDPLTDRTPLMVAHFNKPVRKGHYI